MSLIYRGRSIGVRIERRGNRKWLGTISRSCPECHDAPQMCKRCEAEARVEALKLEERGRLSLVFKRETAGAFAARWTTDYAYPGRWDASTLRHYSEVLRAFRRQFENVPLRDIDATSAREWSQRHSLSYARTIRALMNDALRDDLIERNPFANLRLEPSKGRSEIVAITEEELHLLCDVAHTEHGKHGATVAAMCALAGYTAIRPGELFAVEPAAVRADDCELDVPWQWTGFELKRPKSKEPRTVALPPEAVPYLRELPTYLGGVRVPRTLAGKTEPVEIRPIFRHKKGGPYRQSTFSLTWGPVRSAFEAKLPEARARELRDARGGKPMSFYELRHMGCTEILRRGGTLEDAAHQLGHRDTTLARRTYGHLEESVKLERVKRLYGGNVKPIRVEESEAANSEAANG